MKPISLFGFLSYEWKSIPQIRNEIQKEIGFDLTLPQVRRSMRAFTNVLYDDSNDKVRLVSVVTE